MSDLTRPGPHNPCIKLCRFSNGTCIGCQRSRDEVKGWKRLSDGEKAAINARIQATGATPAKSGKKAARKAAKALIRRRRKAVKLDKRILRLERKLSKLRLRQQELATAGTSQTPEVAETTPL